MVSKNNEVVCGWSEEGGKRRVRGAIRSHKTQGLVSWRMDSDFMLSEIESHLKVTGKVTKFDLCFNKNTMAMVLRPDERGGARTEAERAVRKLLQ